MIFNQTKILIMKEPVPILEKRRIQAEVLGPLFEEMVENIGHHQASSILETAIRKADIFGNNLILLCPRLKILWP